MRPSASAATTVSRWLARCSRAARRIRSAAGLSNSATCTHTLHPVCMRWVLRRATATPASALEPIETHEVLTWPWLPAYLQCAAHSGWLQALLRGVHAQLLQRRHLTIVITAVRRLWHDE